MPGNQEGAGTRMADGRLSALAFGLFLALDTGAALAQGFDCEKARTATEKAICASPALREQDSALSKLYATLLAQDPARAPDLTQAQRQWLVERGRACVPREPPPPRDAVPQAPPRDATPQRPAAPAVDPAMTACLDRMYRARLAALSADAARAAAAVLPAISRRAAAELSAEKVPASAKTDVLLKVTEAGRFAVRAESATGVSLQLVDMIQGPGEIAGEPGVRDGRLDLLLDAGTYKLHVAGAPNAAGEAKLTVSPFREVGETATTLLRGGQLSTELSDQQQRSFWIEVRAPGRVFVEAAGRSLGDLRLWRNGVDLAELTPRLKTVEPKAGHPLTSARLDGTVEPGVYLVTAYGRQQLAWTDGEASEPLHLRAGEPAELAGGWAEGVIGPLGSARYRLPASPSYLRLDLPEPAPARLTVTRRGKTLGSAEIVKKSREPVAELHLSARDERLVEVTGAEGQPFRLRALEPATSRSLSGNSPYWIAVDIAGESADELPVTGLLARFDGKGGATVLASDAPRIGQTQAWRRRFNLRGTSTILFEALGPTPFAIRTEGVGARFALEPLLGRTAPRADGKLPNRWDLEPGWYRLRIEPINNAVGVLDLTMGPPGLTPEPQKPGPARLTIPFGIQTVAKDANYQLLLNVAPGLVTEPVARPLPADLEKGALAVLQTPGPPFEIMVRTPVRGELAAQETNGSAVPVTRVRETLEGSSRGLILRIPPVERTRTVILSWSDPPSPVDAPRYEAPAAAPVIQAGRPLFFDLARDEKKSFMVEVGEGGLYRVETLGRLQTKLALGTSFLPSLDKAEANGAGENALLQTYLRAGRYRVTTTASESSGRLGLSARPSHLIDGDALLPDGSVRATLEGGAGAVIPIEIKQDGKYRLELLGLGRTFEARLEDAEGWPLMRPGEVDVLEREFEAGRYRLVVLPEPVDARAVARLQPVRAVTPPEGHGPQALPFDSAQKHQWREPQGRDDPRIPDRWQFALQGPADVVIEVSDGMIGELKKLDRSTEETIGKIAQKNGFSGRLDPGRYAVEARSLGRNDRLDYTLSLRSKEIQPGRPRSVSLPSTIPFAIAEDRVVSLSTFGRIDVRGVLKDAEGRVIERLDDRTDDWNIALSRQLPAGAYRLELSAVPGQPTKAKPEEASSKDDDSSSSGSDQEASARSETQEAAASESDDAKAASDSASQASAASAQKQETTVEVALALPDIGGTRDLPLIGAVQANGPAVHRYLLKPTSDGLLVAAARSNGEVVLSLDREGADGRWRTLGFDRGKTPTVAAASDGNAKRPWRVSAWAVDGGPASITLAAREVKQPAQPLGDVRLEPIPLDAVAVEVRAALVATPGSPLVAAEEPGPTGLLEGSIGGGALTPVEGLIAPQTDRLWLLGRGQASARLKPVPVSAAPVSLSLAQGLVATLPSGDIAEPQLRFWLAESTFGQPALEGGRGMGVARGSALALSGGTAMRAWNAGDSEPLRISVTPTEVKVAGTSDAQSSVTYLLSGASAQPLRLPPGAKRIRLALPPRTGALAGWKGPDALTVWGGADAVSRTIEGSWTELLLVNLGSEAAPVSATLAPLQGNPSELARGQVLKRFVGAAGSLSVLVEARPGDRLTVAGASATFRGRDGHVLRGTKLALTGPGELVLEHEPGLVAAWIEGPGASPWPPVAPQAASPPQTVKLEGTMMALDLKADAPRLLHVRTTAPVILALVQGGQEEAPAIFPAGAEFHRYQVPGVSELRAYAPQDGALSGSMELTASPVSPVSEGVGEAVAVAPGGAALFAFEVTEARKVGVGVRAEPDQASVRLIDERGRMLGEGVAQLHRLEPGRYIVEARIPANAVTTTVRPTVLGIGPSPAGPPPEVTLKYLEMVGLAPTQTR
jgi:uncharacterized protein YecT (DUF1311 family)